MINLYRIDWHFTTVQEAAVGRDATYGWVETWGRRAASIDAALLFAGDTGADSWLVRRRAFLASLYRVAFVTATAICVAEGEGSGLPAPPLTKTLTLYNQSGTAFLNEGVPLGVPALPVSTAVNVQATRLPGGADPIAHHKKFWLRGLPTTMVNGNILRPTADAYINMLRFLNLVANHETGGAVNLVASPWDMWYQQPDLIIPATPLFDVTVNNNSRRFPIITTAGLGVPVGFVRGARVQIRGVTQPPGLNRSWKIQQILEAAPNQTFTLGKAQRDLYPTTQVAFEGFPGATVRLRRLLFGPADQYSILKLGTKKTGRPPSLTRGRRSRRSG